MFSSYKHLLEEAESQLDHGRFMALINSLNEGFLAINSSGIIELSNSVALDLLNANLLNHKTLYDVLRLIDDKGEDIDLQKKLNASPNGLSSRKWMLRSADGKLISLFFNISPVRSGFGNKSTGGHVIIFRDITHEKHLETARDEFISVISHELKTPVSIAEGSLSNAVLLGERGQIAESILNNLKSAHEQLVFLGSLINDLAMLSTAEASNLSAVIESVNVADLINSIVRDYQPQAIKKGLELSAEIDSNLPKINSSQLYIREIMQNFITNSIKYTEKGVIKLKAVQQNDGIRLSVTDTGIGIDQNDHSKLFTKFFRSDDPRVRQISGTGLGLYVSAKLAKSLGGFIKMTSQLNKGSTFTLNLPASAYRALSSK